MSAFRYSLNRNRRFAVLLNALVIGSLLFGSFSTAMAQDEPPLEPTAAPTAEPTADPAAEPTVAPTLAATEEPTAEPTAPTAEPTAEPTLAPTADPTTEPPLEEDVLLQYALGNDNIANAIPATLNVPYSQVTTGATLETGELENVCSVGDTGSVWYKFKPVTSGIYLVSAFGSNYSPKLSILRYVSSTSRTAVVCGETITGSEDTSKLAFNATAGLTYLVRVSDAVGGGNLSLTITKAVCSATELCGAAVGGNGRVIRAPTMVIIAPNGYDWGYGIGNYSGFVSGTMYMSGMTGTFNILTRGQNNLILTNNVHVPGIYSPTAVGLPKTRMAVMNTIGEEIVPDEIIMVSATNNTIGAWMQNDDFYAPAGTYNFSADSEAEGLIIYQPGITIVSTANPGTIRLDASSTALAKDSFKISATGIDTSHVEVYSPDQWGHRLEVGSGRTFTYAAPVDTHIDMDYSFEKGHTDGMTWHYAMGLVNNVWIYGGSSYTFDVSSTLSVNPEAIGIPKRLDEGYGYISAGVRDSEGRGITEIYYEDYSSASLPEDVVESTGLSENPFLVEKVDGVFLHRSQVDVQEIISQGATWEYILPSYDLYDGNHVPVSVGEGFGLSNLMIYYLDSSTATGKWHVDETVDLGPCGGVTTGTQDFEVYAIDDYPLANDEFNSPIDITPMPYTLSNLDTKGGTQADDDPIITQLNSRGFASAWFKYIPTTSGYLYLDTFSSDYDTVLNVWQGARGALSNRAYNDDYFSLQSQVGLSVTADQTYYIEVTQYVYGTGNPNVQSLEELDPPKEVGIAEGEVNAEQIGGSLTLHATQLPCYSLTATASPATGGTVTRSPAPNCLGTKYMDGTVVTLSAAPKTNFDMWKWVLTGGADITFQNPYVFTIGGDLDLQAKFVAVPGKPALVAPATNALVHRHDDLTLSWYESAPAANTYELQLSTDAGFSGGTMHIWLGLSTASYTMAAPFLENNTIYYWRVRGVSEMGQLGPWSLTRSLRVAVPPPGGLHVWDDDFDFDVGTPDDELHTNRPLFSWNTVADASGYTVQISRTDTFTSLVTTGTISGGATRIFTPAVNLPTGITLYWRVRANAARGPSLWSEGISFSVPVSPPIPVLVSPASNVLTTDYAPVFDWSDVVIPAGHPEFDHYWLDIAFDPAFTNSYWGNNASITVSTYDIGDVPETLPANTTLYWHVRTVDDDGNMSGWSAGRKLRTAVEPPVLLSPFSPSLAQTNRPEFTWIPVDEASGYTIQISRFDDFHSLVTSGTLTGRLSTSFTPTLNLPDNVTLRWRVRANSTSYGPGDWSEKWVVVIPKSPPIPVLVTPANGALITGYAPTLDWQDVKIPSTQPLLDHYEIQYTTSNTFTGTPVESVIGSSYDFPPILLANATYYWRVRAVDDDNNYSGWSAVRSFRTRVTRTFFMDVTNGPGDWSPYEPLSLNTNRPMFRWTDVTGASGYTVQVSKYATFTSLVTTGTVLGSTNLSFTPAVNLPANTTLYWRVRANSATNGPSDWKPSAAEAQFSFTVPAVPGIPTLTAPANNTLTTDTTPLLNWSDVNGATNYYYEVSDDPTFFSTSEMGYRSNSEVEVANELDRHTTYYWRVRSVDSPYFSGWSAVRSIRVAVAAPVLTDHPDNIYTLRPTFDWEMVDGASGYTLQISRNSAFTSLVGTYTRTSLQTDYTPTANLPVNTRLYWRVRADSPTHGPGAWSSSSLDTPNPPSAPTLITPANGATLTDLSPRLDWSTSTLPAGTNFNLYYLEYSQDPLFPMGNTFAVKLYVSITDSEYTFNIPLAGNTIYYWRVKAVNMDDEYSAWSAVRWFRVIGL